MLKQTAHERIMTATESFLPIGEFEDLIDNLDKACHNFEHEKNTSTFAKRPC